MITVFYTGALLLSKMDNIIGTHVVSDVDQLFIAFPFILFGPCFLL